MAASMQSMSVSGTTYQPAHPDELIMTVPTKMEIQDWSTFQPDERVFTSVEELNRTEDGDHDTFVAEVNVGDAPPAGSTSSDTGNESDRIVAILSQDENREVLEAIKSKDFQDILRSSRHLRAFADLVTADLVGIQNGLLTLSADLDEEFSEPKRFVPQGRRAEEQAWIAEHPEILHGFAGQWVVVEGVEIVAHGPELRPVMEAARARGIARPYVFFIDATPPAVARIGL